MMHLYEIWIDIYTYVENNPHISRGMYGHVDGKYVLYIYRKVFYIRPLPLKPLKSAINTEVFINVTYNHILSTVPVHADSTSLTIILGHIFCYTFLLGGRPHPSPWQKHVQRKNGGYTAWAFMCTHSESISNTTYASTQVKNENTLGEYIRT